MAAAPRMKLSENLLLSRYATDRKAFLGTARHGQTGTVDGRRAAQRIIEVMDVRKSARPAKPQHFPAAICKNSSSAASLTAAGGDGRQPADLGRRRRRGEPHPSGADRTGALAARPCLVISQDLDELFEISDAIAVMHNGEACRSHLPIAEATLERSAC
jgi:hypothetical protein